MFAAIGCVIPFAIAGLTLGLSTSRWGAAILLFAATLFLNNPLRNPPDELLISDRLFALTLSGQIAALYVAAAIGGAARCILLPRWIINRVRAYA